MSMRWAVLLVALGAEQDKDTLAKALKATDDYKSYTYTINAKNITNKRDDSKGGEFIWPKIVTWRKGLTEIAKRGDKCMVNEGKGYKPLAEVKSPTTKDIVDKLDAPHRAFMDLADSMEKVQKDKKDDEFDKVKCKIYHSPLTKDGVAKYAKRCVTPASERLYDWTQCTGSVRVYVGKDDNRVHKILFSYTFKTVASQMRPAQAVEYEEHIEFYEIDTAKLNLPDAVKSALEIVD